MRLSAFRWMLLGLMVTVLLLAAACKNQSQSQSAAPVAPSPWKMALTLTPDPPVSEKETAFQIKLTDDAGKSVSGVQLKADLVMATMDMGKNELTFSEQGEGVYRASGKFTMGGPWNLVVTGTGYGKSGQQVFPVVVQVE